MDISYNNLDDEKIFDSGGFIKDWYECNKFIIFDLCDKEGHFSNSSSVDHFIMDGAPFESAYLKTNDDGDTWYLDYEYDHLNKGIEFFVKKGTQPTWEELKECCGDDNFNPENDIKK